MHSGRIYSTQSSLTVNNVKFINGAPFHLMSVSQICNSRLSGILY